MKTYAVIRPGMFGYKHVVGYVLAKDLDAAKVEAERIDPKAYPEAVNQSGEHDAIDRLIDAMNWETHLRLAGGRK